ncbi:sodium- and chloride-dependent GABA transporter 1-like [Chanos chanos]|uniref:Transporter n=1 Tax=Chanos chanos TaxID=29144 RepID=A0A6J2UW84_CHACN|nr:sodium- and chloride-dependent GABA transporter 1-like [Chanos chanos]
MDSGMDQPLKNAGEIVEKRDVWSRRAEFILAAVGYAVGLGNVWRFPYVCYRSGGGAFLIPYVVMLFLCAVPLLFMEYALGQYTQLGPIAAIAKVCPLLKGVGASAVVISFIFPAYFNTIISWTLYYLFNTFRATLPWQSCNNTWNIRENCSTLLPSNATHSQSASQQFFDYRLLEISEGIDHMGTMRWELFGLLILAWTIEYFCVFKGVKSAGKVVYFTALFPYVVLLALFINNVRLPGAWDGIVFFLRPKWHKLREIQVWLDAASQIFFSTGMGFGVMISLASHNKFQNNILRDTIITAMTNSATSIFAGFVIFSALGYMAHVRGLAVEEIAVGGPGLAFVVYPEILSTLPLAQLWAFLFFLMLLCLGLDSQFAHMEMVATCVMDGLGERLPVRFRRKELVVLVLCVPGFLLGLPCVTQGGVFLFQLIDHYGAAVSAMLMTFFEVAGISWIFGLSRFSSMITAILGRPPHAVFKACWLVVTPGLILIILVSSIVQHRPPRYGKSYEYPDWAKGGGWLFTLVSIVWIPAGAIHELYRGKGTFRERLRASVTPQLEPEERSTPPVRGGWMLRFCFGYQEEEVVTYLAVASCMKLRKRKNSTGRGRGTTSPSVPRVPPSDLQPRLGSILTF